MRSICFRTDRYTPAAAILLPALLSWAAVHLSVFLAGIRLSPLHVLSVAMILLLLMLLSRCSARWQDLLPVREVLLMSLLGYTGMLIGVYLDFGRLGLLSLNTICSSRDTLLTLGNWWQMFVLAPATHLLMMLACNAGLLLGACKRRSHLRRRLYWLVIIVSNTGMLAGMWLSQQWDPTPESGHLIRLIAEPATMALLMSILMLLLRDMTLYLARIGTFPGGRYKVRRSGVKQPDLFP